jgi:hypothetical protein
MWVKPVVPVGPVIFVFEYTGQPANLPLRIFVLPIPGNLLTTAMAVMPHTDVTTALEAALSMDGPFSIKKASIETICCQKA